MKACTVVKFLRETVLRGGQGGQAGRRVSSGIEWGAGIEWGVGGGGYLRNVVVQSSESAIWTTDRTVCVATGEG